MVSLQQQSLRVRVKAPLHLSTLLLVPAILTVPLKRFRIQYRFIRLIFNM